MKNKLRDYEITFLLLQTRVISCKILKAERYLKKAGKINFPFKNRVKKGIYDAV